MGPCDSGHDEGGEEHEAADDGVSCHTDLKEEFIDVGVAEEMMEEVGVIDGEYSNSYPEGIPDIFDDFISQFFSGGGLIG